MPKSELHVAWGARVRARREEQQLSQRALAALIGLDGSGVHRIETGDISPSDEVRIRLAQALGVRVEDLFTYPDTSLQTPAAAS